MVLASAGAYIKTGTIHDPHAYFGKQINVTEVIQLNDLCLMNRCRQTIRAIIRTGPDFDKLSSLMPRKLADYLQVKGEPTNSGMPLV
ncbi:hypothetical protein GCM10023116_27870 [Kistimonas scapharcae]|uniref:Uncharacterized protein n=1 Tax=Kistimonas scapharcae TaxID=1036133 RepID=A0ABP8V513_9GAMM